MTFTANSKFVKSVKLDARGKVIKARYLIKQAEKKKKRDLANKEGMSSMRERIPGEMIVLKNS